MTPRRVVVSGMGVVSPHGNDPDAMFRRLMLGESAVRIVSFDPPGYSNVAAPVDWTPNTTGRSDSIDRVTEFGLAAAAAAVRDSGITFDDALRARAGVSFGTGMGAAHGLEETFEQVLVRDPDRVRPLTVLKVMNNATAGHIAMQDRLRGPNLTFSCACSSSAVSIGEAFRQIRHGYADVMLAGGAEAPLTFTFFKTWDAMRVLAPADRDNPAATCRPFSANRRGLVLGEGAAMLVLEERESALRRGATIHAELTGYGSSNEERHMTKPSVDGQARTIELALEDAGITPGEIDYINAHGTATLLNDATETQAIKRVFGERARELPISSTKSMHGHLLGGAGAVELAIAILAIRHQAVPPTANLDRADPECDLDYVAGAGRAREVRTVMSNSFAFGGTNAVLIARSHD